MGIRIEIDPNDESRNQFEFPVIKRPKAPGDPVDPRRVTRDDVPWWEKVPPVTGPPAPYIEPLRRLSEQLYRRVPPEVMDALANPLLFAFKHSDVPPSIVSPPLFVLRSLMNYFARDRAKVQGEVGKGEPLRNQ